MKNKTFIIGIVLLVLVVLFFSFFKIDFQNLSIIDNSQQEVTGVIYQSYHDDLASAEQGKRSLTTLGFTSVGIRCVNLNDGICSEYGVYGIPPSTGNPLCFPTDEVLCKNPLVDPTGLTNYFYCNVDDVVSCPQGCDRTTTPNECKGSIPEPNCNEGYMICEANDLFKCVNGDWELQEDCGDGKCVESNSATFSYCIAGEFYCFEPFQQRCTFSDKKVSDLCFEDKTECEGLIESVRCGDGNCDLPFETSSTCPIDCGLTPSTCGDNICQASENENSCVQDCAKSNFTPLIISISILIAGILLFVFRRKFK